MKTLKRVVDGDTSTNDTMLVLANGASGIQPNQKESKKVEEALTEVMEDLARQSCVMARALASW